MIRFDLKFIKSEEPKTHNPIARIYIKQSSSIDENGDIFITPECLSFKEIENQIEFLKQELDQLKEKARKEFL